MSHTPIKLQDNSEKMSDKEESQAQEQPQEQQQEQTKGEGEYGPIVATSDPHYTLPARVLLASGQV